MKLSETMKQVLKIKGVVTQQTPSWHCKDSPNMVQVGSLAKTSGTHVEQVAREKLKRLAEEGKEPCFFFSSLGSRLQIVWTTLESVCKYLHIVQPMELEAVLRGVCNLLTLENLQAFTLRHLKAVDVSADTFAKIGPLLRGSSATILSRELQLIKINGSIRKDMVMTLEKFYDLLEGVALENIQVCHRVKLMIEQEKIALDSHFLFTFFIWAPSKDPGKRGQKGEIRSALQIDAQGRCVRRGCSFIASLAEIKSSIVDLQHAKLQLNVTTMVSSSLVRFVQGTIDVDRIVLLFKREEWKRRPKEEGF